MSTLAFMPGRAGFIGSPFVDWPRSRGHRVRVLDDRVEQEHGAARGRSRDLPAPLLPCLVPACAVGNAEREVS